MSAMELIVFICAGVGSLVGLFAVHEVKAIVKHR